MADILIAKIHNTLATYSINIWPFLSGVISHIKGLEHLDKMTLTSLLEQASDLTMWFQQDFEVNYMTLLKFPPSPVDHQLTQFSQLYEMFLDFVRLTFTFTLSLDIDEDDYPFLRDLAHSMDKSRVELVLRKLHEILDLTQSHTSENLTTQTETETKPEPKTETKTEPQDNDPTPAIDTPKDPMVYPDSELDSELDADFDFEPGNQYYFNMSQDIEPTETPSDPIETNDNVPPPLDNSSPSNAPDTNGLPNFDDESNIATDSDFDIDSDSDLDSSFEDLEGTFLAICEAVQKQIPPRRPLPLFSFG